MGKRQQFSVSATTAMFVHVLGQILREQMGFKMTGPHEHWTFEQVAKWGEYPKIKRPADDAPAEEWSRYRWLMSSLEYEMNRYLAAGAGYLRNERARKRKIDIRVMIEKRQWLPLGYPDHFFYRFCVWVKFENGRIQRAAYMYWNDDEMLYRDADDAPVPADPPRRIAFWRPTASPSEVSLTT